MRIRVLAASAALAAALAVPVVPAVADEGSATSVPAVTEELGRGAAGAGSAQLPTPAALAANDLGWG